MKPNLDHWLLLVIALVSRSFFGLYRLSVTLAVPIILGALGALGCWAHYGAGLSWGALICITLLVLAVSGAYSAYQLYVYGRDRLPESVGEGGVVLRMCSRFITWIGTLRFYRAPWVVVQEPGTFRIRGSDIRTLVDNPNGLLQPGDILLRGFDGYVDGEFIRRTGGADDTGQFFSHAAIYAGPLGEDARKIACRRLKVLGDDLVWRPATEQEMIAKRNDPAYFQTGPQMVIHSMAKGVHVEDILTFLRCDYVVVIRLPESFSAADFLPGAEPLVRLSGEALELETRLEHGETVSRSEVVAAAIHSALGQIGAGYDCLFEECSTFQRFSCSEFVYYCYKSVHKVLGLQPQTHAIAGMFKRTTVSPGDLYTATLGGEQKARLRVMWKNV